MENLSKAKLIKDMLLILKDKKCKRLGFRAEYCKTNKLTSFMSYLRAISFVLGA